MTKVNLSIFGSEAFTANNVSVIQKEDTVLYEDIFRHIADDPIENLLDITKMNYEIINPIQRSSFFRMPGRIKRAATSHYGKALLVNKPCLCKRFNIQHIKNSIVQQIDKTFSDLVEKFHYKMRKPQDNQIDISLFTDEIQSQKNQFKALNLHLLVDNAISQSAKVCDEYWENYAKKEFLSYNSVQEQINQLIVNFELKYKETFSVFNTFKYYFDDYQIISHRLFANYVSDDIIDDWLIQLSDMEKKVEILQDKYQNLQLNLMNKLEKNIENDKQVSSCRDSILTRNDTLDI